MFTKNSYIKDGHYYMKVLETLGDLVFVSWSWSRENALRKDDQGLIPSERTSIVYTQKELTALGHRTCTAEEAGMPAERWRPENGDSKYYFIDSAGNVESSVWDSFSSGHAFRLHVGNVYKTKEEAESALKKMKEGME